jgi:uncharacterized protein (UPF0332 family)
VSLPHDLLDQAKHLCRKEPKRPKQSSLRRGVSTAYYALFHLLVDAACNRLVSGSGTSREQLRHVLARAFSHAEMKKVSVSFAGGTLKDEWKDGAGVANVPVDLRGVARAFVELQEARHEADYDMRRNFTRQEANDLVARCESAFTSWTSCRKSHIADTYLVALLVNKQLKS